MAPEKLNESSFEVKTRFRNGDDCVAISIIRHIAINNKTRQKCSLPEAIERWLEASSINIGPKPI